MKLVLNNKIIPIIVANSFEKRLIGLMGKSNIQVGMYFPHCNAIHTYFMKEAIDVIGLNEQHKVISICRNMQKNQIFRIPAPISKTHVLELPKNSSKDIFLGSILFFEDEDIV